MKLYRVIVGVIPDKRYPSDQELFWVLARNSSEAREKTYRIMSLTLKQVLDVQIDEIEEGEE